MAKTCARCAVRPIALPVCHARNLSTVSPSPSPLSRSRLILFPKTKRLSFLSFQLIYWVHRVTLDLEFSPLGFCRSYYIVLITIIWPILWGRSYYYLHFAGEKNMAQHDENLASGDIEMCKWGTQAGVPLTERPALLLTARSGSLADGPAQRASATWMPPSLLPVIYPLSWDIRLVLCGLCLFTSFMRIITLFNIWLRYIAHTNSLKWQN